MSNYKNPDQEYRLIQTECGFKKEPHILISILSEIPVNWANNFATSDIIKLVKMLKKYRQQGAI